MNPWTSSKTLLPRQTGCLQRGMGSQPLWRIAQIFFAILTHSLNMHNQYKSSNTGTRTPPFYPEFYPRPPRLPYLSLTILRDDFEEILAGSFQKKNSAGLVVVGHIFPFLVRKTATKYVRLVTAYACKNNICHLCWVIGSAMGKSLMFCACAKGRGRVLLCKHAGSCIQLQYSISEGRVIFTCIQVSKLWGSGEDHRFASNSLLAKPISVPLEHQQFYWFGSLCQPYCR